MKEISALFLAVSLFSLVVRVEKAQAHRLPPEVGAITRKVLSLTPDLTRGKKISTEQCSVCHGANGVPAPSAEANIPYIADQTSIYLIVQLASFKTGHRNNPTMKSVAGDLSSQDIADLTAYLVSPEPRKAHCGDAPSGTPPAVSNDYLSPGARKIAAEAKGIVGDPSAGKALAELSRPFPGRGRGGSTVHAACINCHGERGVMRQRRTLHPDIASLGKGYLINSFAAFKTGDRVGGPMGLMARDLTAKNMADLAAYYSILGRCR